MHHDNDNYIQVVTLLRLYSEHVQVSFASAWGPRSASETNCICKQYFELAAQMQRSEMATHQNTSENLKKRVIVDGEQRLEGALFVMVKYALGRRLK
jgi:hypothetical protein